MIIRRYINGKRVDDDSSTPNAEEIKKINAEKAVKPSENRPATTRKAEVRQSSGGCGCGK